MANCPACGDGVAMRPAYMVRDRYARDWWAVDCQKCGVTYQLEPMTDEQRREFYGSGEYRRLCEQVTGKPWTDREYLCNRQLEYAWQIEEILEPKAGRWLDYGGSTGVVSQYLRRYHGLSDYEGLVIADYGDGATVTPEQAWELGPYDTILCCQTLDHLREPLVTLKKFREVACPNARLFVDVVKKQHTEYKIDHDCYFSTAQSFVGLVERAGWSIVWLDCETNPTHYSILAEKV